MTGVEGHHQYSCHSFRNPMHLRSSLGCILLSHEIRTDRRYRGSLCQKSTEAGKTLRRRKSANVYRSDSEAWWQGLVSCQWWVVSSELWVVSGELWVVSCEFWVLNSQWLIRKKFRGLGFLLTTHHWPLTTHHSQLRTHHSLLTNDNTNIWSHLAGNKSTATD